MATSRLVKAPHQLPIKEMVGEGTPPA